MKINYKYVWRGFNFNRDTQLFAEFFKNTPMIKLLKHNAKTEKYENLDDIETFYETFDNFSINKDYIIEHNTLFGNYYLYVEFNLIKFDELLSDNLISIIYDAHEAAKFIKNEGCYEEVQEGSASGLVYSLVAKWSYYEEISLLDVFAQFLYAITKRHLFGNGNKRTALISLVLFMQRCGLFLGKTNNGKKEYLNIWEPFMIEISSSSLSDEEAIEKIRNKLKENTYISFTRFNL